MLGVVNGTRSVFNRYTQQTKQAELRPTVFNIKIIIVSPAGFKPATP